MIIGAVMVAVGLLLAFNGRRLVWLLIGAAGFLVGYFLARLFWPGADALIELFVGLALGFSLAFFARGLTRFVLGLAGFFLIGGLAYSLAGTLGMNEGNPGILIFLLGGLVGIGIAAFAFELSLILYSVLGGVALFAEGLPALVGDTSTDLVRLAGFVVAVLGFIVQWSGWRKGK